MVQDLFARRTTRAWGMRLMTLMVVCGVTGVDGAAADGWRLAPAQVRDASGFAGISLCAARKCTQRVLMPSWTWRWSSKPVLPRLRQRQA